jgi:hypothetical protein
MVSGVRSISRPANYTPSYHSSANSTRLPPLLSFWLLLLASQDERFAPSRLAPSRFTPSRSIPSRPEASPQTEKITLHLDRKSCSRDGVDGDCILAPGSTLYLDLESERALESDVLDPNVFESGPLQPDVFGSDARHLQVFG